METFYDIYLLNMETQNFQNADSWVSYMPEQNNEQNYIPQNSYFIVLESVDLYKSVKWVPPWNSGYIE